MVKRNSVLVLAWQKHIDLKSSFLVGGWSICWLACAESSTTSKAESSNIFSTRSHGKSLLKKFAEQLDEGKDLLKTVEAIKDTNKRGALHFAALEGQTEICNYLLEDLKLQIDSKDDDGETALIHSTWQGHAAS
ncbi:hypothetical protein RYX36_032740 [Vicia faba]